MNLNNLLSQLGNATNPMTMITGMLNPNQKQMLNMFQMKDDNSKAQEIANYCNQNNISKEQLQSIINMISKKR